MVRVVVVTMVEVRQEDPKEAGVKRVVKAWQEVEVVVAMAPVELDAEVEVKMVIHKYMVI